MSPPPSHPPPSDSPARSLSARDATLSRASTAPATTSSATSPLFLSILLLALAAALVPLASIAWQVVSGLAREGLGPARTGPGALSVSVLARSVAWAAGIGVLATLPALPGAWAARRWGWRVVPLLLVPMLCPSYLAYAGWGVLRAPGTWLGDAIASAASGQGAWRDLPWPDLPWIVSRVLAVGGLALWSTPTALLVLAPAARRIAPDVLDLLALDTPSALRRARVLGALLAPAALGAVVLVTLVMLGSAVPLHLARVPTASVELWLALDQSAPGMRWSVYAKSAPLLALALAAGWVLSARLAPRSARMGAGGGADTPRPRGTRGHPLRSPSVWAAATVWALGVLAPLALFAVTIRDWHTLTSFWRATGPGAWQSAQIAAVVGAASAAIGAAVSWAAASGGKRTLFVLRTLFTCLLATALMPGVVLGASLAELATRPWMPLWVGDYPAMWTLAHILRFSVVGALAGAWLAATRSREERDLARLDGAQGLRGWYHVLLRRDWPVLGAAGVAAALLSVHEIESTIFVQPPTTARSLAGQVLSFLHFARTDELAAAGVTLLAGGVVVAVGAAVVVGRSRV